MNNPLQNLDVEAINSTELFAMYSVYALTSPLHGEAAELAQLEGDITAAGVEIRGFYDVSGFRADADIMLWMIADDPVKLQEAYAAIRRSHLGAFLDPVWSVVGSHRPAEFNRGHVPNCFNKVEPRPWVTVYPFVRSYEWYYMDAEKRSQMLRVHGMSGREYPDVLGSTLSAFALGDYEWILAFEADNVNRLVDAMRHQRGVEARLHVREETPFFTGPRVELQAWIERQPKHA